MKTDVELRGNVLQLTTDHARLYEHEQLMEGGTVPGLIQQVRSSIAVSGDRAGSAGGKPVPLNMPAFSLYERISRDLQRELLAWHLAPAKVNGVLQVEGSLWAWSKLSLTQQDKTLEALVLTRQWIASITALFTPVRETELVGHCPACGFDKCTKEIDGDECVISTLVAVGATVTCQHCTASWAGEQLHWLKAALLAKQEEEAADTPVTALA